MVELYLHSPIRIHGVVLKELSREKLYFTYSCSFSGLTATCQPHWINHHVSSQRHSLRDNDENLQVA
jgi:hypothetical protein